MGLLNILNLKYLKKINVYFWLDSTLKSLFYWNIDADLSVGVQHVLCKYCTPSLQKVLFCGIFTVSILRVLLIVVNNFMKVISNFHTCRFANGAFYIRNSNNISSMKCVFICRNISDSIVNFIFLIDFIWEFIIKFFYFTWCYVFRAE